MISLVVGRPWQINELPVLTRVRVADTGISVEIPSVLAGTPEDKLEDHVRVLTFARPQSAPLIVQFVVNDLPQAVSPQELDNAMQDEQRALQEVQIPEAHREGDATLVRIGGRPFAIAVHRFDNKVVARVWVSIFGKREVLLRIYSLPGRPPSWAGIEDKIVASLQVP
jgi:hypothetical protein